MDRDREDEAAWGFVSGGESRIPAALGIFAALALYLLLPDRLTIGPGWVIPALEAAVLVPLVVTNPSHRSRDSRVLRALSIGLIGLLSVANFTSLGLLIHRLLHGGKAGGRQLIYSAMAIWVTNVIVFGLWYWELDRGGPLARTRADHRQPDFLFPQMTTPAATDRGWVPNFLDYLYVAFTNATAFSPTDAMPLTPAAKALMLAQSVASVLVIVVVGARAVNILS
ncbi:MAG TPA: hypothetical protein VFW74_04565 [Acidimicrobiia bacterium]|nr:hypothetical protein [Acidimicrobiia bacterium]